MMTIDPTFFELVAKGAIKPSDAIAALVQAGHNETGARELVFVTVGGSDIVQAGDDGIDRYFPSGKTINEVERAMEAK